MPGRSQWQWIPIAVMIDFAFWCTGPNSILRAITMKIDLCGDTPLDGYEGV